MPPLPSRRTSRAFACLVDRPSRAVVDCRHARWHATCDSSRVTPLIVVGCGYVGSRLARAGVAAGRTVRALARSTGRLAPLAELGVQVKYLDVQIPKQIPVALSGLPGATVVYSIPPVGALPPGLAIRAALQAAYGAGASCFIYFSSSGLYG